MGYLGEPFGKLIHLFTNLNQRNVGGILVFLIPLKREGKTEPLIGFGGFIEKAKQCNAFSAWHDTHD